MVLYKIREQKSVFHFIKLSSSYTDEQNTKSQNNWREYKDLGYLH